MTPESVEKSQLEKKYEELNVELQDKNFFKNEYSAVKAENNRLKEELLRSREFERTTFERTVRIQFKLSKKPLSST